MGIGILICGLNGCGKSAVGRALSKKIGFHFIDNENLYFTKINANEPYTNSKSRDEVEKLLMDQVYKYGNFIFTAVKGDYGKEIVSLYKYIVHIEVPKEIRLQRVRNRSFQKFGDRMLAGGELYEQEESFFRMIESRSEDYVENWVRTLNCPVIKVDGTKHIEEIVELIVRELNL